jgi:hypothetical protein
MTRNFTSTGLNSTLAEIQARYIRNIELYRDSNKLTTSENGLYIKTPAFYD